MWKTAFLKNKGFSSQIKVFKGFSEKNKDFKGLTIKIKVLKVFKVFGWRPAQISLNLEIIFQYETTFQIMGKKIKVYIWTSEAQTIVLDLLGFLYGQ